MQLHAIILHLQIAFLSYLFIVCWYSCASKPTVHQFFSNIHIHGCILLRSYFFMLLIPTTLLLYTSPSVMHSLTLIDSNDPHITPRIHDTLRCHHSIESQMKRLRVSYFGSQVGHGSAHCSN